MKTLKIGLALSGGGYRAAVFHLGVLKKLHELNVLEKITSLSTVSGGSIVGAYYLLNKDNFNNFYNDFKDKLRINIQYKLYGFLFVIYLILFTSIYLVLSSSSDSLSIIYIFLFSVIGPLVLILLLFFKLIPANSILKMIYDKYFFNESKLSDLPNEPIIYINSTNIETGNILSFSKNSIIDNGYPYFEGINRELLLNPHSVNISYAVTASSAFSPMFAPLKFNRSNFKYSNDYEVFKPLLIDGGIYDNQGIHRFIESKDTSPYDIIICSDCALPYKRKYVFLNSFSLLSKTIEAMMKRIRAFQFSHSIYGKCSTANQIIFFSFGWSFDKCIDGFVNAIINKTERRDQLISLHSIPKELLDCKIKLTDFIKEKINYKEIITEKFCNYNFEKFKRIKTELKPLTIKNEEELIEYASILCELQLKLYYPNN